jgi:hypothetical protein
LPHCIKASTTVEIGDLHYFAAPPRAFRALSPQRRRAAKLLTAAGAAVMWLALLLASFATVDWTKRPEIRGGGA